MNKFSRFVLIVLVVLVAFTSVACKNPDIVNPCAGQDACGMIAPAGDLQSTVTEYLQNTCDKRADGTCKTMGE